MRRLAGLILLCCLVAAGCSSEVAGSAQPDDTAARTADSSVTDGDAEPCALLTDAQRGQLGVGPGQKSEQIPLEGAQLCNWDAVVGRDMFQAGVLPSRYRLDSVTDNYPDPQDVTVSGLPGVSTSQGPSVASRSCMIFALLPDQRLAVVSYFWNGGPTGSTHEMSCRKATVALEMVVATSQAR